MSSDTLPLKATKEVKCRQKASFPVFLTVITVSNSNREFQCKQGVCSDFHSMFLETCEPHKHL